MSRSNARRSPTAGNRGQGGKWIRPEKRLRIYERDGWRCVWCGAAVMRAAVMRAALSLDALPHGARLACLDHVLPRTRGGSNDAGNLVTSCCECNEARGDRSAIDFAFAMQERTNTDPLGAALDACAVLDRVIEAMGRELPPSVRKPAKAA